MSRCQPHVESLINRYLDGEITARELEDLRAAIQADPEAKRLFERMKYVDGYCQQAVQRYVLSGGRSIEDLIADLWPVRTVPLAWADRVRSMVFSRFAVGLAAGLLLGLLLSLAVWLRISAPGTPERPVVADNTDSVQNEPLAQVNLYYFKDSQGNLWAIEGFSEERVRNVAYQYGY